jgi:hypothetical protein
MLSKAKGKPMLKIKEISMFTQISNYLKGVFHYKMANEKFKATIFWNNLPKD